MMNSKTHKGNGAKMKSKNGKSYEELEKEAREIEEQLKKYNKNPDFGDDIDGFDEETDEAEEYSKNLGIIKALKDRQEEIKTKLSRMKK